MRDRKFGKKSRRAAAAGLAAVMTILSAVPAETGLAAEPAVSVDETMYVNLDYYGAKTGVSVVKGCTTNGVQSYTDYGAYEKVVNMTDSRQPAADGDGVTWEFDGENERFYYEGVMNPEQVELPWTFDVSYKLNGVEKRAEDLAGASGLIEIHVAAEPNELAEEYYKNNMILSVVFPVDMAKCYSVDAPGAQLQSVGTESVAVFMALPGEEGDFTIRIGTDDYESIGVLMMMVPGRLDALNNIKDLKEAKDTWREDGNQMYESIDALLGTLESMKGDVGQVKEGLTSLDRAREIVSGSRPSLESSADAALNELDQLTVWTAALVPYLQTARQAVTDINNDTTRMSGTMYDLEGELDDLYGRLGGLRDNLRKISRSIPTVSQEEKEALLTAIQEEAAGAAGAVEQIKALLDQLENDWAAAEGGWSDLDESLSYARSGSFSGTGDSREDPTATPSEEPYWIPEEVDEEYGAMDSDLELLRGNAYLEEVRAMLNQVEGILGDARAVQGTASAVIDQVNGVLLTAQDTADDTAKVLSSLGGSTEQLVYLLDDMRSLIDTVDGYVPDMMEALRSTEDLMTGLSRTIDSTHSFLSVVENTLKEAGDSLDEGTRATLQGAVDLLDKSLQMLDDAGDVRSAGADMKTTLDEQLDKFEEENNFLNMDPEAEMISFTSEKNPEPNSLQIIVRTDEISEDTSPTDISDEESGETADEGPFQRMWNVFVKIFQAIVDIFKNR